MVSRSPLTAKAPPRSAVGLTVALVLLIGAWLAGLLAAAPSRLATLYPIQRVSVLLPWSLLWLSVYAAGFFLVARRTAAVAGRLLLGGAVVALLPPVLRDALAVHRLAEPLWYCLIPVFSMALAIQMLFQLAAPLCLLRRDPWAAAVAATIGVGYLAVGAAQTLQLHELNGVPNPLDESGLQAWTAPLASLVVVHEDWLFAAGWLAVAGVLVTRPRWSMRWRLAVVAGYVVWGGMFVPGAWGENWRIPAALTAGCVIGVAATFALVIRSGLWRTDPSAHRAIAEVAVLVALFLSQQLVLTVLALRFPAARPTAALLVTVISGLTIPRLRSRLSRRASGRTTPR